MKLGIDIGNTKIGLALISGQKIETLDGVLTRQSSDDISKDLTKRLKSVFKQKTAVDEVLIGSVVPAVTRIVETVCRRFGAKIVVIGRDLPVPIKNLYRSPRQVGIDRLLCAYAAKKLYGQPLIVIDFGTAITFESVSATGAYEGGLIIPGIQISLDSLSQKTALLPRVEHVEKPKHFIGQTTEESILSGILNGYGAMCDGLIQRFLKDRSRRSCKIILTGGYAKLFQGLMSSKVHHVDETLVYKGMALLERA